MNIITVQWNIGGGKILKKGDDPTLMASYSRDGMADIVTFLKNTRADIITLQEVHKDDVLNQAEYIAKALGLEYIISDFYANSHIEEGQELGHAIISRFPLSEHDFELLINPKYQITWEDGSIATSHDKGVSRVVAKVNGRPLKIATTHLTPFRRFDIDPTSDKAAGVLADVQAKLQAEGPTIIQGDFNLNLESLESIFNALFKSGMQEVRQIHATTPKGHRYDHVLYKGIDLIQSKVENSVLTDHYPVVTEFSL